MRKFIPLLLLLVSCKTVPPEIIKVVETVEVQAQAEQAQIVEIEKTVEKIVTITDGEAKTEALKLSGQVKELKATNTALIQTVEIMKVDTEKLVQANTDLQKETGILRKKYTVAFRIALLLFALFVLPKLIKLILKLLV